MIRVHDFHLTDGDERCSIVTNAGRIIEVQVGGITLTVDQLAELHQRVLDFDPNTYEDWEDFDE